MPRTFHLTASSVLTKARAMINDLNVDGTGYRVSDPLMIGCLNDALNAMVGVNPGLFSVLETHTCQQGYMQSLFNDRAVAFQEVIGLPQGDSVTLSQFSPGWMTAAQATAREWMPVAGDPLRFMVYPPSPDGQSLTLRFVKAPAPMATVNDLVPVPENYEPALVEYVAGRAEMANDESVDTQRATSLMDRFVASVAALKV